MSLKIITVSDGFGSETVPSITDPAVSQTFHHVITIGDITSGSLTLPVESRDPLSGMLYWIGVGQSYGVDFDITGSTLNFLPRKINIELSSQSER